MPPGGHHAAVTSVLDELDADLLKSVVGVGHRVVHGGPRFTDPVLVDDQVRAALGNLVSLAPLHLPANLRGIDVVGERLPALRHVAVFDTGFHSSLPSRAYRYAVPQSWFDDHGARRYGFHGISCRIVTDRTAALLGRPVEDLRLVVAHLGGGCSATAVSDGRSVDTSMGFTPLEGLVMTTRSGDIDPGLLAYLAPRLGLDLLQLVEILNTRSGLAGLSGMSGDIRELTAAAAAGSPVATLALEVFSYRLAKTIAAMTVPLARWDALVFTGGIGEHSPEIRSRVMALLGVFGVHEDAAANAAHGQETAGRVSLIAERPGPTVLVVPTDEERVIASDTALLLGI